MLRFALPSIPSRPALPAPARTAAAARRRFGDTRVLFAVGVVVPTLVAAIYFGLFASGRYVSEADFVVRGANQRRVSGLDMLFQSFGLSRAVDDANAVQSYLLSRDALAALLARVPLRDWFGSKRADLLSRFPRPWGSASDEQLYAYYRDRVSVIENASKGITTLRVEAFDPGQAQAIAAELLDLAETMVNAMNARAHGDAVRDASADLAAARGRLLEAEQALTDFRIREVLIDPSSSSVSTLDTVTALSTDLARADAEVGEARITTGASPSLPALQSRAIALADRVRQERARIAGDADALAPRVAAYERLTLDRQLAEKSLAAADSALQAARQEARQQAVYIERVVSPQRPDEAIEPERLRTIATVLVLCFAMTSVVWILIAGANAHAID